MAEYEGYTSREAEKVHEDIAEAIECLNNVIILEVGPKFARWVEKILLVEAERNNAENLRDIHESLMEHLGRRPIIK
jgi:predicted XRE-type DNA-binding protein